ncbi:AMP deaminase, partial [Coemansia sp. Benny D115]
MSLRNYHLEDDDGDGIGTERGGAGREGNIGLPQLLYHDIERRNSIRTLDDELEDEEEDSAKGQDANDPQEAPSHPYISYNSLANTNYQAGPSFVNAYFANQPPAKGQAADSPSQKSEGTATPHGQGPAAAAIIKCKRGLSVDGCYPDSSAESSTNISTLDTGSMRGRSTAATPIGDLDGFLDHDGRQKERGMLPDWSESVLAADPDVDDDITSRKLEDEIRGMMRRVHIKGSAEELHGMNESPEELKRIGDALIKCMTLRDKYMDISHQHEIGNPKNHAGWNIYPPPPPPAWHAGTRKNDTPADHGFEFSKCDIPSADTCVFSMGKDGVYAVH